MKKLLLFLLILLFSFGGYVLYDKYFSGKIPKLDVEEDSVNLDNTDIGAEIRLNNEKLKNKFLKNSIAILSSEIDEVKDIFSNELQEFNIPSRPLSEKASSVASNNSRIGS